MSNKVIKSVKLFFQEQPSDKVYNASLLKTSKGYSVSVEWGRRGTRLSTAAKVVDASLDKAQEVYDPRGFIVPPSDAVDHAARGGGQPPLRGRRTFR